MYEKINDAITNICLDPFIGDAKKGDLKGFFSLDVFHQASNYELCYKIEEDENGDLIVIILIGPRENFYPELKRYLGF
ncbi:type II toxin-antitoxin system RelE/ParE family toxin [Sporosarcina sp. FA9]|uniref:type II toxin-antitoxin system RelE/ParE family toxin n=1 Tax=Sporosarcina sp. FA9 TaxID=3413030 RepID=UPI003F659C05